MIRVRSIVSFLVIVAAVGQAVGQAKLEIKLDQDKKVEQMVSEGTFIITVVNQLPKADYERAFNIQDRPVAPIDLAAAVAKPKTGLLDISEILLNTVCDPQTDGDKALRKKLEEATTEKDVAAAMLSANEACTPETKALVAATKYEFDQPVAVKRGQELIVTISRGKETWNATYITAAIGSFRTSYGFSFLPNHDKEYFTLELGTGDNIVDSKKFEIRRKRSNSRSADFVPTVNFSWYPAWRPKASWSLGPTVGLGFDFSNPVVLAGVSATYNQNLTISFGAAAQKQKRLLGQYSEGQRVRENLESTALLNDTYAANFFISVSIRTLVNPFK